MNFWTTPGCLRTTPSCDPRFPPNEPWHDPIGHLRGVLWAGEDDERQPWLLRPASISSHPAIFLLFPWCLHHRSVGHSLLGNPCSWIRSASAVTNNLHRSHTSRPCSDFLVFLSAAVDVAHHTVINFGIPRPPPPVARSILPGNIFEGLCLCEATVLAVENVRDLPGTSWRFS